MNDSSEDPRLDYVSGYSAAIGWPQDSQAYFHQVDIAGYTDHKSMDNGLRCKSTSVI